MQKLKCAIFTLGCRVNQFESVAIADRLHAFGVDIVEWGESANFGIVNSCALTRLAETKTRRAINDFIRKNPEGGVAVTGCYAQTNPEEVAKIRGVKLVVGNKSKMEIAQKALEVFAESEGLSGATLQKNFRGECLSKSGFLDDRTNLKIQDGCDNFCSYCIIPRARGLPQSRDFKEIVEDAKRLAERGVAEIVVTGINISKFSTPDGGLLEVLDALNKIDGICRLRIGSLEPPNLPLDALLARMKDSSHKLCPHLHLSAQSLNNRVLSAMRRKYSAEEFLDFAECAAEQCPDISIGTDLICGHPEEGEAEFADTREKLASSCLAYAHVFTFSARPLTRAYSMQNTPPRVIATQRATILREDASNLRDKFFCSQTGKSKIVLIENTLADGTVLAHTDNYIQCAINADAKLQNAKNKLAKIVLGKKIGGARLEANFVELL